MLNKIKINSSWKPTPIYRDQETVELLPYNLNMQERKFSRIKLNRGPNSSRQLLDPKEDRIVANLSAELLSSLKM